MMNELKARIRRIKKAKKRKMKKKEEKRRKKSIMKKESLIQPCRLFIEREGKILNERNETNNNNSECEYILNIIMSLGEH